MIETRVLSLAPECDRLLITYMLEGNIQEIVTISRDHKGVVRVLIDRVDEPLECVREFILGE
jgi:hypothetical protein